MTATDAKSGATTTRAVHQLLVHGRGRGKGKRTMATAMHPTRDVRQLLVQGRGIGGRGEWPINRIRQIHRRERVLLGSRGGRWKLQQRNKLSKTMQLWHKINDKFILKYKIQIG